MNRTQKLSKLFKIWKIEQEKEKSYINKESQRKTSALQVDETSFTYDGFVFDEKDNTILYILAESNLEGNTKADNQFWFKSVYKVKNNNLKLTKRIEKMQEYLCQEIPDLLPTDISFMNINKKGGFAKCDWNNLIDYYNKYRNYIWREIEIINPKIIVICFKNKKTKQIRDDLKKNVNCKYIIDMYHPSYQFISNKNYMKVFEDEFKNLLMK